MSSTCSSSYLNKKPLASGKTLDSPEILIPNLEFVKRTCTCSRADDIPEVKAFHFRNLPHQSLCILLAKNDRKVSGKYSDFGSAGFGHQRVERFGKDLILFTYEFEGKVPQASYPGSPVICRCH